MPKPLIGGSKGSSGGNVSINETNMLTIGRRWQKGDMDRIYVNTSDLFAEEASNGVVLKNHFNRFERNNLKVYYDVSLKSLVSTLGNDEQKSEIERAVKKLIKKKK